MRKIISMAPVRRDLDDSAMEVSVIMAETTNSHFRVYEVIFLRQGSNRLKEVSKQKLLEGDPAFGIEVTEVGSITDAVNDKFPTYKKVSAIASPFIWPND